MEALPTFGGGPACFAATAGRLVGAGLLDAALAAVFDDAFAAFDGPAPPSLAEALLAFPFALPPRAAAGFEDAGFVETGSVEVLSPFFLCANLTGEFDFLAFRDGEPAAVPGDVAGD